jgi:hypothetical protein
MEIQLMVWLGRSILFAPFVPVMAAATSRLSSWNIIRTQIAIAKLCKMEYWTRVWIIQEIILAKRILIHCRSQNYHMSTEARFGLDWDLLIQVCSGLADLPKNWPLSESILDIRESIPLRLDARRKEPAKSNTLRGLLTTFEDTQCSEPRDKVYGLLGLAQSSPRVKITVDYAKSLFDVFKDVVWFEGSRYSADIFALCAFGQLIQRTLGGPFWFNDALDEAPDDNRLLLSNNNDIPRLLLIGGIGTGTIVPLESAYESSIGWDVVRRKRLLALRACFQTKGQEYDEKDTYLAKALTELEVVSPEVFAPATSRDSYASKSKISSQPSPQPYMHRTQNSKYYSRLFLGANGQIGLSSACAREGDVLCQFLNSDAAVIIHPRGDHYQIVGRAVVAKRFGEVETRFTETSPYMFKHNVLRSPPRNSSKIYFYVDAVTLQTLTCPLKSSSEQVEGPC